MFTHAHTCMLKPSHVSTCMHSLLLSLHAHILGANRGMAIDKCRSAPSSDMMKPHRLGAACAMACTFVRHWPVSFGLPLVCRKSATLSSASHSVHQQQPSILMCRDDAVRAAMLLALSLSLFSAYCVAQHISVTVISCVLPAPSSYAHTVSSLTHWFSPVLDLLSFSLSLRPPPKRLVSLKPLPAGALELDWRWKSFEISGK